MLQSLPAKQPSPSQSDFAQLRNLFHAESQNLWAIGDELLRLKRLGHKLKDIAKHFGRRKNRLSELLQTAKAFPAEKRDPDVPFFRHELARLVSRRDQFNTDLMSALTLIQRRKFTRRRQVYAAFGRAADRRERIQSPPTPIPVQNDRDALLDRCHHCDYRDLLGRFEDSSIKVIHADPPYGVSAPRGDLTARADCDNAEPSAALEVTLELLEKWQSKLALGGCLLLWQQAGVLRLELLQAIQNNGWEIAHELIWERGPRQFTGMSAPYDVQVEKVWVLKHAGDELRDHSGDLSSKARSDILRFPRVRHFSGNPNRTSIFQKPRALCELLIRKHSSPGDLLFDAFGCSGEFCLAARKLGRKWVYAESNEKNFAWGAQRLGEGMSLPSRVPILA